LRLQDKFGDQGIIAVLLALSDSDQSTLKVDSFLVSCRALGRGVEDALWAATLERAHQQKLRRLEAEYIATAKNGIVAELYDRFGLQRIRHDNGSIYYCLQPIAAPVFPPWIRMGQ
jgi:predicted enzyme involved in methoxymalonyl-ACP biosynthesis